MSCRADRVLAEARGRELAALAAWLDLQAGLIVGPVPDAERLTWDAKEAAARNEVTGTATAEDAALLDQERSMTGETRKALAVLILSRAALFRAVGPRMAGVRRQATETMGEAATPAAIEAARKTAQAGFTAWVAATMAAAPTIRPEAPVLSVKLSTKLLGVKT